MNAHADINSQLPAKLRDIDAVIAEYDKKLANIDKTIEDHKAHYTALDMATTVAGEYVGRVYDYHPGLYKSTLESNLRKSAWRHAYKLLNVNLIASAKDRGRFDIAVEDPPEFTLDNIRATFGDYLQDSRHHILKGLAECFCDLDQAYKSHSKVKIGAAKLPKRIILPSVADSYGFLRWGGERLRDTINAMRVFEGRPHVDPREFQDFIAKASGSGVGGEATLDGMRLKCFRNGNGHLHFTKQQMDSVNKGLAEFYGEVLPDVDTKDPEAKPSSVSTEVSKDLQFYKTPKAVIDRIMNGVSWGQNKKFLEPSCGDGAILDAIKKHVPSAKTLGIEYHRGRVEQARAKGHKIMHLNFLATEPTESFDYVIMNPPFYGTHWKKHLEHGRKFLKKPESRYGVGSVLICILPASAYYDGHLEEMGIVDAAWTDLPVGSFAESGTNVPTGYVVIGRRGE